MNGDEFQLTVPSNSSAVYFPGNKPNLFKTMLPSTLNLAGEWEVALIDVQYPHNWTNFNRDIIAVIAIAEQNIFEALEPAFKDSFLLVDGIQGVRKLKAEVEAMLQTNKDRKRNSCALYLQVPTGYYDTPQTLVNKFLKEFRSFGKNDQRLVFNGEFDAITKKVVWTAPNYNQVSFISAKEDFFNFLGIYHEKFNENIYSGAPLYAQQKKALCSNDSNSMYIYCDIIKYQIVGDIEAPLFGVLPVQGRDGEQIYWGFNPPYYIPVNTDSLRSFEIRICNDMGELFPFDPSGKVVCRLHFRRKRLTL